MAYLFYLAVHIGIPAEAAMIVRTQVGEERSTAVNIALGIRALISLVSDLSTSFTLFSFLSTDPDPYQSTCNGSIKRSVRRRQG